MEVGGGRLAGLCRKRPSGLGFKHGLHGENAGATENASRGSGWREGGRRAARCCGTSARNQACGKVSKRGKTGRQVSLPQGGTPAAAHGDREAARRRWRRAAEVQRRRAS
jgi:hypothetical protein